MLRENDRWAAEQGDPVSLLTRPILLLCWLTLRRISPPILRLPRRLLRLMRPLTLPLRLRLRLLTPLGVASRESPITTLAEPAFGERSLRISPRADWQGLTLVHFLSST